MATDQVKSASGVTFPDPGGDCVAQDLFEQGAESAFAVVAVCQEDHAGFGFCEADEIGLGAIAMAFFEECGAETGFGEQAPAGAVGQAYLECFLAWGFIGLRGELVE